MASSKEVFSKLEMWKKSKTPLKLTIVIKRGMPEILRGQISATDEDSSVVGFFVSKDRGYPRFDLRGASFRIGKHVLEAERDEEFLTFEEEGLVER
jgi:hypothetical protein